MSVIYHWKACIIISLHAKFQKFSNYSLGENMVLMIFVKHVEIIKV